MYIPKLDCQVLESAVRDLVKQAHAAALGAMALVEKDGAGAEYSYEREELHRRLQSVVRDLGD